MNLEITGTGASWRGEWHGDAAMPYHVVIEAARLREHSDSATAELTIRASENGTSPAIIKYGTLNLLADRSREQWAKRLADRWPGPVWDDLLEIFSHEVLVRLRAGEPVVDIRAGMGEELKPPQYVLYPFILEQDPTMLYAKGGVGKSWVGLIVGMAMHLPLWENGLGLRAAAPAEVLYLDYEDSQATTRYRLGRLCLGCGLAAVDIHYRRCHAALVDETDTIKRICDEHKIGAIIVDSIGMATSDSVELSDKRAASILARATRDINLPCLWIHHTKKGGLLPGEDRTSYGSAYFENEARSVWYLEAEESDGDTLDLAFYHKKMNNGRRLLPFGWRLTFEDPHGPITPTLANLQEMERAAQQLPLHMRIAAILRVPMTANAIAEELGAKEGSVKVTLNRHKDKFCTVNGLWLLSSRLPPEQGQMEDL